MKLKLLCVDQIFKF